MNHYTAIRCALTLLTALAGCRDQPPSPPPAPLEVRYAGCAELSGEPVVCAVGDDPLRIWIPGASAPTVRLDGAPITARVGAEPGGQRVEISLPIPTAPGQSLTVDAGGRRFTLPLAPPPPPIDLAEADAEAQVEAALATAAGPARARLLRAAGRIAMRRGALDAAAARFVEAEAAARAAGLWSEARLAAITRAHARFMQGRVVDARAALAGLPPPRPEDAYGAYATGYATALVARGAGDLRAAVMALDAAAAVAEQVGLVAEGRMARNEQGIALIDLGRLDEATAVLGRLRAGLPADGDPCVRGDAAANLAWAHIRAGRPAVALLDEALEIYAGCSSQRAHRVGVARVNLAVAHLDGGDPAAAVAALEGIDTHGGELGAEVAAWRLIVEGRVARAAGDSTQAEAIFTRLVIRAEGSGAAGLRWRAHLERGLTAEARCDWAGAAADYEDAEALLFDESLRIAAGGGRAGFLADRGDSAALLVRARVAAGQPAAAFEAARRARRRGLLGFSQQARLDGLPPDRRAAWEAAYARYTAARATLEAERAGDWDRSTEALAALAPARAAQQAKLTALLDEMATLAGGSLRADAPLLPLTAPTMAWSLAPAASVCLGGPKAAAFAFAAIDGRVEVAPLADLSDPFAPFAAALDGAITAGASRVELMPTGRLRDRDLHLTPIGGAPLGLRVPVAWRLDGPVVAQRIPASRRALVVVDPRVDLAGARREGAAVVERLRGGGWTVDRLQGAAATRAALRAGFAGAELFHYAGHAVAEGLDGWQSAFLLAEGPMTVGDLLTLPAVPRWAVLAGCETGRAPGEVSGIGLAHALLATGAEAVIATVRPVADADAAAFSGAFYGALGPSIEGAYRAALAAVKPSARGAFRLWVP